MSQIEWVLGHLTLIYEAVWINLNEVMLLTEVVFIVKELNIIVSATQQFRTARIQSLATLIGYDS